MARTHLAESLARRLVAGDAASSGPSDRELLEKYLADRDEEAFAALVRRHGRAVLAACRQVLPDPADADDAFQATFLTLLRRAGATTWRDSLGAWLYAVAHRTAVQARRQARRRRTHEARAEPAAGPAGPADLSWREACGILHEEIDRLPDRYRLPLLLCYLEGQSREEAAKSLGWTPGAVKGCLERGRRLLAARLDRRGVTLAAGLLAVLAGGSARAARPTAELVLLTLRAVGGGGSPAVAALVHGGPSMSFTGQKLLLALAAAAGLAAAVGTHHLAGAANGPPPAPAAPPAAKAPGADGPAPATPPAVGATTLRGRALGTDGRPLPGAKLVLLADGKATDAGETGPDGRFTVAVAAGGHPGHLILKSAGAGFDFAAADPAGGELELRAVPDNVIRGRVVDTQGRPVAGATVAVESVGVYPGDSADPLLAALARRGFMDPLPTGTKHFWPTTGPLFEATTDAAGRFALAGVGAERLVGLRVSGPGIATAVEWVVNRKGFDPKPHNDAQPGPPKGFENFRLRLRLHGPEPALVAEAEKPVRGRVVDADTGAARAGVEVALHPTGNELVPISLRATTDAAGRYEVRGARKAPAYTVEVASDPATGHVAGLGRAADTGGYEPVVIDLKVKKGVVVTGRIVDKTTGKPIAGSASVAVLADNAHAKGYPELGSSSQFGRPAETKADGTFRVVAIPGPVLLMGGPGHQSRRGWLEYLMFKPAAADPAHPRYFMTRDGFPGYHALGGAIGIVDGNTCRVLDLKPGSGPVEQDLTVESGTGVPVRLRDAEGKPVTGAYAIGLSPGGHHPAIRLDADTCPAFFLEPGTPRLMIFFEPERNLAGSVTLTGGEKDPVAATLGPAAAVKGRLVDEQGKPLAGVTVELRYGGRAAAALHRRVPRANPVVTDAAGAFAVGGVLPGQDVELAFSAGGGGVALAGRLKPGETRDAGEIKLHPTQRGKDN